MKFIGLMRVKNGARWIAESLESIQPLCDSIMVFDDRSTDDTVDICRSLYAQVISSPFDTLDESRDKTYLLRRAYETKPDYVIWIDADEVLEKDGPDKIRGHLRGGHGIRLLGLKVPYYWNDAQHVRVDGSFNRLIRPTVFKVKDLNPWELEFSNHGYAKHGLHCGCVPVSLEKAVVHQLSAALWHYGYIDAHLRRRKFDWYRSVDPGNAHEDYQHVIQGDPGGPDANEALRNAGPLELQGVNAYAAHHNFSLRPREY